MSYTYLGEQYEMKPLTIGVKKAAIDIIEERNKLVRDIEAKCNLALIQNAKNNLARLERKRNEKLEANEDTNVIDEQISKMKESQENNSQLQAEINYYESELRTVGLRLVYNIELMNKVIPAILDKPVKLDFENLETEKFILEVVNDFFLSKGLSF